MSTIPDGTKAKEVALYFLEKTDQKATRVTMGRTILGVKELFSEGYHDKEIINVINYIVDQGKVQVYSFNYIISAIDDILRILQKEKLAEKARDVKEQLNKLHRGMHEEVSVDDESAERNRKKTSRVGVKSRVGEKFNFDLLKE